MKTIWSVARQMIAEGIRMKIAGVFLVLLGLIVLGLPFSIRDNSSVTEAVQSFLTYSLSATSILLGVLTIFMSRSLSDELVNKQIFLITTKPVPRWQYVLGKWLGMSVMNAVFLVFVGLAVYGMAHLIRTTHEPSDPRFDMGRLVNEVMVARHVRTAHTPDFTAPAENEFQRNLEQGIYQNRPDFRPAEEKERLARKYEAMWRIVPPMGMREFEFTRVLCDRSPENYVQFRYKTKVARYPPDEVFRGLFIFGDRRKNTKEYEIPVRHIVDRYHTVRCPADAVAPDDTLLVRFVNENPYQSEVQFNNIIEFPRRDQPEVLFVVGSFFGNLCRLLVMMQCKLMFLAAIALLATTVLSFPVASLLSFTVYVLAGARGFIDEAIEFSSDNTITFLDALQRFGSGLLDRSLDTVAAQEIFLNVVAFAFAGMKYVVPDFGYFDGVETFVDGRNVSLAWVLQAIGELAVLKTGIALGLAMLFFHRREVAEVSL